ncbi:DMT family transporter [Pricia sp. S334]|uniref:DMT family transporter n=1 Tax=Pricia mediterranea TaxID=3076079 RepID=A0ABU3L5Y7_9FLAO|nr:DMT family transporter [Pricia sp. S334]MDT7828522.1 DMT family transporter [Pricia sp. S334]
MGKAVYAVVLCALIAGSNGILIKYMTTLNTGAIAFFRTMVPVVFLAPVLFSKKHPLFTGNYKKMLLASAINVVRIYLYLVAFIFTSIGNAVVLFYSWPIFVFVLETLHHSRPLKARQAGVLLIAFAGLVITYSDKNFSFENADVIGMVAAVLSAITYALTVLMFKSESHNYSKEQTIVFQNLVGAFFFIPFLFFVPDATLDQLGVGIFYGFLIGIIVFKLFFYGLKHLEASTASSLMYLEVVSAMVLGYIILEEELTLNTVLGGALIIISSYLITRIKPKNG